MKKGDKKGKYITMFSEKKCLIDVCIVGVICFILGFLVCYTIYPMIHKNHPGTEIETAGSEIQEQNQSQNSSASYSKHTVYDITPETMLAEANRIRTEHGVAPLQLNQALNKSAQEKCDDMVANNYYDHKNPTTGQQGYEIAIKTMGGIRGYYGENMNVIYGSDKGADDVDGDRLDEKSIFTGTHGWMKSEPHAKAIIDPKYTLTGFGKCTKNDHGEWGDWFFIQHFYSPTL